MTTAIRFLRRAAKVPGGVRLSQATVAEIISAFDQSDRAIHEAAAKLAGRVPREQLNAHAGWTYDALIEDVLRDLCAAEDQINGYDNPDQNATG